MKNNHWLGLCLLAFGLLGACSWDDAAQRGQSEVAQTTSPQDRQGERVAAPPLSTAVHEEVVVTGSRILRRDDFGAEQRVRPLLSSVEQAGMHWMPQPAESREQYADPGDNPVKRVAEAPVSTFSIDVDTAAYSNVRRMLNGGILPPPAAVRAEEFINYFDYDYPAATDPDRPFSLSAEAAPSPWNAGKHLLRIGLKGYAAAAGERPPANLVFLVDVSGSMQSPDKLPLLQRSLALLLPQLDADDRLSLVVYAGASGVVLEPTPGNEYLVIEEALSRLRAGGSTNGGAGIELAYALARQAFIEEGINRVVLASDGDFNVGLTDFDALLELIAAKRESGITLTVLGFGSGNLNDRLMEQLADRGNGHYAYIDSIHEARKVLVESLNSTLQVIAGDVKIQLEFNPAVVSEYRLVGYENRLLGREDFNNDQVDAGEVGAGHSVTALYEISLAGSGSESVDPLRYGRQDDAVQASAPGDELAYLKLRYKLPGESSSRLIEQAISAELVGDSLDESSASFRFAAAAASLAQVLGRSPWQGEFGYDDLLALAAGARGEDPFGYRAEFIKLVHTAKLLDSETARGPATEDRP